MGDREMPASRHRQAIGAGFFVLGFTAPAFIPIVTASDWKVGISGLLDLGVPEIMMIAAVAAHGGIPTPAIWPSAPAEPIR